MKLFVIFAAISARSCGVALGFNRFQSSQSSGIILRHVRTELE
jgi:hypothetical protein